MPCLIHLADALNNARGHQKTGRSGVQIFGALNSNSEHHNLSSLPTIGLTSHSLFSEAQFLFSFYTKEEDDLSELEFGKQ